MEIYQLRSFLSVLRVGHLTRAAEQLHLTQSAVSKQIKALEDELGLTLFIRSPSGMTLTPAGKRLAPLAKRTVDAATELANLARSIQGHLTGTLRLGTIIDPESIRLGELLREMRQHHPQVEVVLEHGISGSVLQRVKAGELDACFYLGTVDDADLTVIRLSIETYLVAAPVGWRDRLTRSSWTELAAMPWIGTPAGSSQTALIDKVMKQHGLSRQTVVQADQESSMIELVNAGVGLCLVRERLAREIGPDMNIVFWAGDKLHCPLALVARSEHASNAHMAALFETTFNVWPSAVYQ
ncbi:LysR family transcriptional regulator [Burkholderia sp. PU8-34]